jgi:hypothetical protein
MRRCQRSVLVGLAVGLVCGLPGVAGATAAPNGTGPASASPAFAHAPIQVDVPGWTLFDWGFVGEGQPIEEPFTFSSSAPVVVKVTDVLCRGDQFEVFDFGVSIGTTSVVPVQGCDTEPFVVDPDVAFEDPSFSHGSFILGPGFHSITIVVIADPFGSGSGYIAVDSFTKDQCKNGGWQSFGVFKNQGDCVSFVATGGKHRSRNLL